ncbi:hypothetical protein CBR_g3259 [Chara braunii]|uniref:Glucan endo-1,3-beta-D-glucosidase n=1 Tax=Chara braunii TaxID=69332 RepID=A0A388KFD1_CHABU|nr:hypothetical protein CBR_g3259 [Chara braunii]|eukprot:GBG68717.1 hypothetical protein CBR_g3259 [Chara braunii]
MVKQGVGVNYGIGLSNRPIAYNKVVEILRSTGANSVKLFQHDPAFLNAMAGQDISVVQGTSVEDINRFASDFQAAKNFVANGIVPFLNSTKITSIAVGNEANEGMYGGRFISTLVPAMRNVHRALVDFGLERRIKVTTPLSFAIVTDTYPPSAGRFADAWRATMRDMLRFLTDTGSCLTVNIYPFFTRQGNPRDVTLDYALGSRNEVAVRDGPFNYTNLMDAMVDSVIAAMTKEGFPDLFLEIGETGWPTADDPTGNATISNAQTYNNALVSRVLRGQGTPRRPGWMQMYIFALLDEDRKPAGVERHWGIYRMEGEPKYTVKF